MTQLNLERTLFVCAFFTMAGVVGWVIRKVIGGLG